LHVALSKETFVPKLPYQPGDGSKTAGALVFFFGALLVVLKNYYLAGLSGQASVIAAFGLIIVKTWLGVYYTRIATYAVDRFGGEHTMRQDFVRGVTYAVAQTTTFTSIVVFLTPAANLPKAIGVTFLTSLLMAPIVNRLIPIVADLVVALRARHQT
jgi:hypothetical protein